MLIKAHRDIVASPRTLLGLTNLFSAISYRFLATIKIIRISLLSNTLVRRRR